MKKFLLWQIAVIALVTSVGHLLQVHEGLVWLKLGVLVFFLVVLLGCGDRTFSSAFDLAVIVGILGVLTAAMVVPLGTRSFWAFATYLVSGIFLLALEFKQIVPEIGGGVRETVSACFLGVVGSSLAIIEPKYALLPGLALFFWFEWELLTEGIDLLALSCGGPPTKKTNRILGRS